MTVNAREGYGLFAVNGILFNHESPRRGEIFVSRKVTRAVARILHGLQKKLTLEISMANATGASLPNMWRASGGCCSKPNPKILCWLRGNALSKGIRRRAFAHVGLDWRRYVEVDPQYYRAHSEIDRLEGDASRARDRLGWTPRIKFRDLVKIMVDADVQLLGRQISGQLERRMSARGGE